jgi:iron-sulfur cluster repair protein YtfE (RIC family)
VQLDLPQQRDVVEVLMDAHIEVRQIVSMAESLAEGSATSGARETATTVSDHVEWLLPMHFDDEELSLAPRLLGRHRVVDDAIAQMKLQHLALTAPLARLRLLCLVLSRDISRLHALRFEVGRAAKDLRERLAEHHALEESIVFPALKRLLYVDELESIQLEMRTRRMPSPLEVPAQGLGVARVVEQPA